MLFKVLDKAFTLVGFYILYVAYSAQDVRDVRVVFLQIKCVNGFALLKLASSLVNLRV